MSRLVRSLSLTSLLLALASPAAAQTGSTGTVTRGGTGTSTGTTTGTTSTTGTTGTGTTGTTGARTGTGAAALGDDQALLEERTQTETHRSGFEPGELHDETYLFLGAMVRALIVPTFIQNIFVSEGSTPIDGGFGIYFNYRHNAFNVQLEAYYQSMYNEGFYKGAGDADSEFEFVRSRLAVIMGNVSFGWAFDITDWFAFELGFGIGFGGVVGDLWRQEAYRDSSGGLATCAGPNSPSTGSYCEGPQVEMVNPANGHLDDGRLRGGTYQLTHTGPSPFYFGDGGVPPIFFNIDLPRIAFRFKPLHQLQIRIEAAYNLYGFSFGGSVGYGF